MKQVSINFARKKVFSVGSGLLLALFAFGGVQASANPYQEIEACGQDVACVGKVLARMIQRNGGGGGSQGGVTFFHDDGRCESDELIAFVPFGISEAECERRGRIITTRVWGVKFQGDCKDVRDKNFVDACKIVSAGAIPQSPRGETELK